MKLRLFDKRYSCYEDVDTVFTQHSFSAKLLTHISNGYDLDDNYHS